jgi:hypothetical protein
MLSRPVTVAQCPLRLLASARKQALVIAMVLAASLATLSAASPALGNLHQEFAPFADCPLSTPGVTTCLYATTTSGEFTLANKTVPVSKTITIQGGLVGEGPTCCELVPAADGNTLSKTALPVPGGLVGIELLGNFTEVTATAELAGTVHANPNAILSRKGVAVSLPLKVKLDNPLLGSGCYVASESTPLQLQLITGTTNPPPPNKPISGSGGTFHQSGENQIATITNTSLVDNSFVAPGANGCTLLPLVGDLAVDVEVGLPGAAGRNTAILNGTLSEAEAPAVAAVLPLPDVGRCEKTEGVLEGKKTVYHGRYTNASCVAESETHTGKYEWTEGPGAGKKFTGTSKALTIETVGKSKVTCSASASQGEYTGPKTQSVSLTLTGCKGVLHGKSASCQNTASQGEITTSPLDGELEFTNETEPAKPIVGLDLKPTPPSTSVVAFECGGEWVSLGGSVIAPISAVDKMASTFKLKAAATEGRQTPEQFEGGVKDTLTVAIAGGAQEQAGLTASDTVVNEEPLEIKGAV